MSKYGVFSGPYFPVFALNMERYEVSLRIQSECGKIRTRKNSVSGHFSRSVYRKAFYRIPRDDYCCNVTCPKMLEGIVTLKAFAII